MVFSKGQMQPARAHEATEERDTYHLPASVSGGVSEVYVISLLQYQVTTPSYILHVDFLSWALLSKATGVMTTTIVLSNDGERLEPLEDLLSAFVGCFNDRLVRNILDRFAERELLGERVNELTYPKQVEDVGVGAVLERDRATNTSQLVSSVVGDVVAIECGLLQ
jgi:hypothetical protein